jgi:fucose 4-O-acetylase-like acetyltransferase
MNLFNSSFILNNKRFGWIDYDRGISIVLVTYRHCFESLGNSGIRLADFPFLNYINIFLFGFRMPLFFIASGIFISTSIQKYGLAKYATNRVQTILHPLFVWGVIQISLQIIFSDHANTTTTPIYYLYLIIDPRETAQFWYLNALFFVGIIYSILKVNFKVKVWQQITIGLLLYFLLALLRMKNLYFGFVMDIFQYYLFFALGDAIASFMLNPDSAKIFSSRRLLLILLPLFITIQIFFTKINLAQQSNYFVEHHMPIFFLLVAFVGCALSINISFILKNTKKLPILRVIGYHSVHVYCMQIIAMAAAKFLLIKIFGLTYPPLLVALILVLGLLLPMLAYNLFLRLNMWWLFSLKKPVEDILFLKGKKTNQKTTIQEVPKAKIIHLVRLED